MSDAELFRHVAPGAAYADPVVIAVAGGRFVEVSGQIGFDHTGAAVPADFAQEVRSCFEHVERSLERADATLTDLVRIRAYLTSLDDYAAYAQARSAALPEGALPASTAVGVATLLAGARVEIEATAFVASAR